MQNGDKITFYTRTQLLPNAFVSGDSTDYGNNLEVCFNRKNEGTYVGVANDPTDPAYNQATDRGDFELLLSINPPVYTGIWEYKWAHSDPNIVEPGSFPSNWTRFEVTIGGLNKPQKEDSRSILYIRCWF
jgi:hypothetical protein